ncbi:TonB-dependent receptor [Flavobacterium hibernum]|uniref:TonB-dependent receptor n=1 Tax=Flavobacterium hibernum TaxID=37752 RepID=A0A0D0EW92_9FLAO|nr:TonB-dependent receptor [Flavobacterium hibernum]KIO51306.1 TonB-dependent receptor [Flavobacterium hibernum]OXA85080.1 TonB-dependent receptor [Flavobacterium hibernum]STO19448.1 Outer membrane cobalamin receptor protein [Flavobacterium hibernum]
MKINCQNKIIILLVMFVVQLSFSQKKQETIGTETVNVVKPYSPTISDAFKVKETPSLDDAGNQPKETIKYSILSVPVASTFTPSKGKAEGVEKSKKEKLFNNYATLGVGNYGTLNAELFVNQDLGNNDYVAGMFRHHSSQGGISGVNLNDEFYDTALNVAYGVNNRDMSWNVELGYQNQIYNWYGLPADFGSTLAPQTQDDLIRGINPNHSYNTITAGGNVAFNEGIFSKIAAKFTHFSDSFSSSENRFYVKPTFKVEVMDQSINTNIIIDHVSGSFEHNYARDNTEPLKYSLTNFGIEPSFVILENDWTLELGAGLFYGLDSENSGNKFYIYPKVNASYKLVGDLMIFYTGVNGGLEQNSYADLANQNPFLSPTLNMRPTNNQYTVFAGLKGKLANNINYNLTGSYLNEKDKALYKANDYTEDFSNQNYAFGNSFGVVYDDVRTLRFYGELKADFSQNVSFGINGTFNSYKFDGLEAWNLPSMKLSSNLDVNITKQWYAGLNVFYVGERKDMQTKQTDFAMPIPGVPVTLKSYFDANAHVGYKYNERLTFFLKLNNIGNQAYQKWMNYPVQGFQVLVGGNYKFDF